MTRFAAAGLPRVRALGGAGCGAAGLALLTPLLVMARDRIGLAEVALLYLVPVIAAAAIGGLWPALLVALAADLLVNFFFVPPYHTLLVDSQNHVIVLIIYLLVAASLSATVDIAAQQRAIAARRDTEARLLAKASATPVADDSLSTLLSDIRDVFGMTAVVAGECTDRGAPGGRGRPTGRIRARAVRPSRQRAAPGRLGARDIRRRSTESATDGGGSRPAAR